MSLVYNAMFDKNTRKLSFEDKAGNEIYSFTVPERGPAVDDITKPLTFRATQNGSTVRLTSYGSPSGDFQTSRDGGNTWVDYSIGSRITLNTGDEVSFRAKSDRKSWQNTQAYFYFEMTGKIEAWHNVMSMLRPSDFATYDIRIGFAFYHLFENCGSLTKAPILPATTFVQDPYQGMFLGCVSLTKAPELPATTLSPGCYSHMFSGCQSLTEAPELPATTLANLCYYGMFEGCQSLTKAPELPATTLATSCYYHMFEGCQSLKEAPELPATTLSGGCYSGMFVGCGSLNKVRCKMPSTISAEDIPTYTGTGANAWLDGVSATGTFYTNSDANWPSGASGIPTSWNRVNVDDITKPLTFRATQDGSSVTLTKFGSPVGAFQTSRDGGNTWVNYTTGTAIALNTGDEVSFRAKADRTSVQNYNNHFYFEMTGKIEAWHNVMSMYRTSDFATYNTVGEFAFSNFFRDCTSLTKAPALPATTLAGSCYYRMFGWCQSLTKAPALPATTLAYSCYGYMFLDCQSLTKAPVLPATTLANECYKGMFSGCRSLKEVRISATTTATDALKNWLENVAATGDFYCDPNATIFPSGASGIPSGWTRRNIADYPN